MPRIVLFVRQRRFDHPPLPGHADFGRCRRRLLPPENSRVEIMRG